MTQPTETGLTEPDNPSAWALARHIADHPVSVVQAAFRYLNAPLTIELHGDPAATPAGPTPATNRDTLRQRIADALRYWVHPTDRGAAADAVLAVLPAPDQRAAVVRDAAIRLWHETTGLTEYGRGARWAIGELRRLAGETQQAPCGRPVSMATPPCSAGDHCCEGPSEAQQDPTQAGPRRGDWFEQWLVMQRDRHGWQGTNDRVIWDALDTVVGLYRMYADAAVARSGQPETDEETPRAVPCSGTTLGRRLHGPHRWEPQPGMDPVRCPGYAPPSA